MNQRISSYREFWPFYLSQHRQVGTRIMHYIGTALSLLFLGLTFWQGGWTWLLIPLAGYGFAWVSHFSIEHNKPATFTYPLWSLVSDYRMFLLWISGRLDQHIANIPTTKHTAGLE